MILMLLILLLAGTGMFFAGVRGLITKRVTIYSGKWLLALIAICFLPQFLTGLPLLRSLPALGMMNVGMYVFLLLVFWFITKGCICFGISEESVNSAFKSTFAKLGLKYEQLLGSVRLDDGAVFQVSVQSWIGTMQIKPKNQAAAARMPVVMAGLSEYFSTSGEKATCLAYWLYTIAGVFMLATLLVLAGLVARLPHKSTVPPAQDNAAAASAVK